MEPIEIITIIACVLIVGGVLGTYIYKKVTHKSTGSCSGCSGNCASCSHCVNIVSPKEKKVDEVQDVDPKSEVLDEIKSDDNNK